MPIAGQINEARRELLDLSLRNPLINYRRLKGKGVQVVDEVPSEVFRILVKEDKGMHFVGVEEADEDEETSLFAPSEEEDEEGIAARHTDNALQTPYAHGTLQKRLLATYYAARTYIEEQGVNILYLALGMIEWWEANDALLPRHAPLILVPVELERTSIRARFRLNFNGEDIGENLSLRGKLKSEFGIDLPVLPSDSEDIDLNVYFDAVEQVIAGQERWRLDDTSIELGFFSFGKFLMFNDLDVERWPV
ncbi:MAG TPA: DUF4011 domain-containing protein, partial [Rhodothermales bacterium]|nr:DUF4011 domain-containing protein [Rhodothermales bacterium]